MAEDNAGNVSGVSDYSTRVDISTPAGSVVISTWPMGAAAPMPLKGAAALLILILELMFLLDDIVDLLRFPNAMVRAWLGI